MYFNIHTQIIIKYTSLQIIKKVHIIKERFLDTCNIYNKETSAKTVDVCQQCSFSFILVEVVVSEHLQIINQYA